MAGQKNYFGKGNIRPNFPGTKRASDPADPNLRLTTKSSTEDTAKDSLRDAESSASTSTNTAETPSLYSPSRLRNYERKTPSKKSLFVGSGKKRKGGKLFSKLLLARLAPLALILGILIAIVVVFGSQSFLGAHIEALFTEATNTDYTAYNLRSNEIMQEILAGKLEMPDYLRSRLEKEGIKVVNSTTLEYDGATITADNFITMYNSNVYFREAVTYARRGRIATFFDSAANNFYKKLGLSRDVLHSYTTTGDQNQDTANYDTLMTNYYTSEGGGSTIDTAEERTIYIDEDGNEVNVDGLTEEEKAEYEEVTKIVSNGAISSSSISSSAPKEQAKEYLDSIGDKVSAKTPGCAALQIGNIIATAIASNSRYIPAHEFMTTMESISKSKYGAGSSSAINSVLNWFTESKTSTVYDARTGEEIELTGAPLDSEGMRIVLGGLPADRTLARRYSLERSFESTNVSLANSGLVADACQVERAAGVVLSLAALAMPGSNLIRTTVGLLLGTTIGAGIQVVASSVLSLLIPTIAEVMYTNPYTNAVGIAGGETFTLGAANINMLAAQQNSGSSGASKSQVLAYNSANNLTIAQQAEVDRKNYSPFDMSNKNTFLGSIAHSLTPLASSLTSISSTVSTFSSLTKTSLASINPTYADGEDTSYLTSFGNYCDKTSEVGAASNIYCTMIAVNDLSTINLSEDDPEYQRVISESVDIIDGKEVVRDNSPLADYITYWMGRYSMPGIYDANIANACEHRLTNVPVLTDVVAMVESIGSDYCKSVADGSRYINSDSNPYWNSTEKYHQLWVLTARVKENLGFYSAEDNPVAVYRVHYDETHPLDNSRSGYLARISGLTKEEATIALNLIDYYQEIANYHPEKAYNFSSTPKQEQYSFGDNHTNYYILNKDYSISVRREGQIA